MNKVQSDNEAFFTRSGSFATHGARTGVNLLGWGAPEILTDRQRREALIAARMPIEMEIIGIKESAKRVNSKIAPNVKSARHIELQEKMRLIDKELFGINSKLNRRAKGDDLGHYIIKAAQAKMTKPQWACVMAEARELFEADLVKEANHA